MSLGQAITLVRFAVLCALFIGYCRSSYAAEIEVDLHRRPCQIRISGVIVHGDLLTFKSKLPNGCEIAKAGPIICLNSPGGDFSEALDLAGCVAKGYSTYLEPNATCESACSWIFIAGINHDRGGTSLGRSIHVTAKLGFHAPYIDPSFIEQQRDSNTPPLSIHDAVDAYDQAVSEIGKGILRLAKIHTSHGRLLPLIDASLLAEALVRSPKELLLVDTVGKVTRWNIGVTGVRKVLPRGKDDIAMACRNALAYVNEYWD